MAETLIREVVANDDRGQAHTIRQLVTWKDIGAAGDDPNAIVGGGVRFRTADGMAVNRLDKGVYQIVQTGVIVRCDSPDAP